MNREMSDPFNESKFECRAKEVYKWGNPTLWDVFVNGAKEGFREGSAIQSQRIESVLAEVETALAKFLETYVDLVNSVYAGFWDPEKEPEVIASRQALVLLRGLRGKNEKA